MASALGDDSVPQWKKDLILRKRLAGGRGRGGIAQPAGGPTSSTVPVAAVSAPPKHAALAMVQDALNGDCCPAAADDSDSSEELQYGPGIVSKLKSKYLSLALRENAARPRPALHALRRATSLEDLLDVAEPVSGHHRNQEHHHQQLQQQEHQQQPGARRFLPRTERARAPHSRYRATARGHDVMKRARSVETLSRPNEDVVLIVEKEADTVGRKRSDSQPVAAAASPRPQAVVNGNARVLRPKRIAPIMDEAERPPADHVKHTLLLFEGPPARRTKPPKSTGDVAAKVANFKHIIDQEKPPLVAKKAPGPPTKPHITPKPALIDKPRKPLTTRSASPRKVPKLDGKPARINTFSSKNNDEQLNPDFDRAKPVSPRSKLDHNHMDHNDRPILIPDVSRSPESESSHARLPETPDLILHSGLIPFRIHSPTSIKSITAQFITAESKNTDRNTSVTPTTKIETTSIPTSKPPKPAPSPSDKITHHPKSPTTLSHKSEKLEPELSPLKTTDFQFAENYISRPLTVKTTGGKQEIDFQVNGTVKTTASRSPSPRITSPGLLRTISPSSDHEEIWTGKSVTGGKSRVSPPGLLRPVSPSSDYEESDAASKSFQNQEDTEKALKSPPTRVLPSEVLRTVSPSSDQDESEPVTKSITKQAMENIGKAGNTVTFNFSDNVSKSHLPRLNTVPVRINRLVPDIKQSPQHQKSEINGSFSDSKPIMSPSLLNKQPNYNFSKKDSPKPIPESPSNVRNARPATPVQNKLITSREMEKNIINKVKTLEQPVSKVVVSMKSVEDVVVNKNITTILSRSTAKPGRNQEQTTILFNFQNRDTIPDYIATDGSSSVRRGKREKPKPGESGIILLPGAPSEEFCTDEEEDWMLSLNGPPSPCDVAFENDNILIDGKSSISKYPKPQKMRIKFDDQATKLFMYPSEASLLEEQPSPLATTATPTVLPSPPLTNTSSPGHAVPSLTGSSLASYTPSKMSLTTDFQLGVTRTTPQPPVVKAPSFVEAEPTLQEPEQPITYSAETNSDILF